MKAYHGKKTYGGQWSENLNKHLNIYETLALICEINNEEKLRGLPIMLSRHAFDNYSENSSAFESYENEKALLQSRYNIADKKSRVLLEWKGMSLTNGMRKRAEASEVQLFNDFVAALTRLQKQLDHDYHHYRYLRDRLVTDIDIHSIQEPLRDRMPRDTQRVIQ